MALRTKIFYGEQVMNELSSQNINRDFKIDIRECIIRIDAIVNAFAREGILATWKMGATGSISDLFTTTFEWLTATDPANSAPSFVQMPSHYVQLPDNRGIDQVYFQNSYTGVKKKMFDPIIVRNFKSFSQFRSNRAGKLEGRISCAPKNGYLVFDRGNIDKIYGPIGLRLVVRDSSALADTDPYPIAADQESLIISSCVDFFRQRMAQKPDLIRDDVNKT